MGSRRAAVAPTVSGTFFFDTSQVDLFNPTGSPSTDEEESPIAFRQVLPGVGNSASSTDVPIDDGPPPGRFGVWFILLLA